MAPAFAVPRLLARNGLTLDDIDYFEIHEAFAGTVLSTLAAWEDEEFGTTGWVWTEHSVPLTEASSTSMAPLWPRAIRSPLRAADWLPPLPKCSMSVVKLTDARLVA